MIHNSIFKHATRRPWLAWLGLALAIVAGWKLVVGLQNRSEVNLGPSPAPRITDLPAGVSAQSVSARDPNPAEGLADTRTDYLQPPPNMMKEPLARFMAAWNAETDPGKKDEILSRFVEDLALADYPLMLALLTDAEFERGGRELRARLFRRWGDREPHLASSWVSRMSAGQARTEAVSAVVQGYASRDFEGALALFKTQADPSVREPAILELAGTLAGSDPLRAFALGAELSPSPDRDRFLTTTASMWAALDGPAAAQWAAQIPDETLQQRMLGEIVVQWSDKDPVAAATRAMQSMVAGRTRDDAVISIIQRWAQHEPEAAGEWVLNFPQGELRDTASTELVKQWSQRDIGQTGEWVNAIQDPAIKDVAIAALAGQIGPQAPALAGEWILRITDSATRSEELGKLAAQWMSTDAASARAWVSQQASLPEDLRNRLLRSP